MEKANEEGSLSLIDFMEVEVAEGPLNLAFDKPIFFPFSVILASFIYSYSKMAYQGPKKTHTKANVWKENATHFYNVKITKHTKDEAIFAPGLYYYLERLVQP